MAIIRRPTKLRRAVLQPDRISPKTVTAIPDVYRLMTRDAELAKARNAPAVGSVAC